VGFTGIHRGLGKLSGNAEKFARFIPYVGGGLLIIMGFYFLLTV